MKNIPFISEFIIGIVALTSSTISQAQLDCSFKAPVFKMDFGASGLPETIEFSHPSIYQRVQSTCPNDGFYSIIPSTSDCFTGDWHKLETDHTPGDEDGRMLVVNAAESGGVFLQTNLTGIRGNTRYELDVCLMNVCRINGGCQPLPPNIIIYVKTSGGKTIAEFHLGQLIQTDKPYWKNYAGFFTTGQETSLFLIMEDKTIGGCGNDFAMDDLIIYECRQISPPTVVQNRQEPEPETRKPDPVKPPIKQKNEISEPEIIRKNPADKTLSIENNREKKPEIVFKPVQKPMPMKLATRENPLIKKIEADAGELKIFLYDNGQIDGDTVSIYHNQELVVSSAALSQKPVILKISIDKEHPHHELVMVAENLGSIPPNTSLMIIHTPTQRYEVFISSTEQKNAMVVIDLKE